MPKIAREMTALEVKRLNTPGSHAVGVVAGLLLQIRKPSKPGATLPRSWILRTMIGQARRSIGLGPYPQVPLALARDKAAKILADIKSGVDPKSEQKAARSALIQAAARTKTFEECAVAYLKSHAKSFRSQKAYKQWISTFETYVYPFIGRMAVADVGMRDVLDVFQQEIKHPKTGTIEGEFWHVRTVTAERLLGRVRSVLDFATVNEYRSGINPATWKGHLDRVLASPRQISKEKHHPALPYADLGNFMVKLRANQSISALALEFLILTAVRSGSVRKATWSEVNFRDKLWIIPAEHTKTNAEHRVPLSLQAIAVLKKVREIAVSDIVFPSPTGKALSDMALSELMRGMRERGDLRAAAVPHGFRSTFRDWAAEQTSFPEEIRKVASGHTVGNAVDRAYQRTDLLDKRRELMNLWGAFTEKRPTKRPQQALSSSKRPDSGSRRQR
jgi:integrase